MEYFAANLVTHASDAVLSWQVSYSLFLQVDKAPSFPQVKALLDTWKVTGKMEDFATSLVTPMLQCSAKLTCVLLHHSFSKLTKFHHSRESKHCTARGKFLER